MDERRQSRRTRTDFHAEVRDSETGELLGNLADISSGGMMLIAEQPLPAGRRMRLEVELPRGAQEKSPLTLEAQVCWSQPEGEPNLHAIGLEFVGTEAEETAERLRRLLGSRG